MSPSGASNCEKTAFSETPDKTQGELMKFSDLSIGDTFLFGDYSSFIGGPVPTGLGRVRYRKISDDTIEVFHCYKPRQFTVNKDVIDEPVYFVGQAFEQGEKIEFRFNPELEHGRRYVFVSENGKVIEDRKVSIEDLINAGFGNYYNLVDSLVLFSGQDPSVIVDFAIPVKRTGPDLLELSLHKHNQEDISTVKYQQLENGGLHFTILTNDKPTKERISPDDGITLRFFLENENLFANTKTLREHEQDYIAAKRECDIESKDSEKESPCYG